MSLNLLILRNKTNDYAGDENTALVEDTTDLLYRIKVINVRRSSIKKGIESKMKGLSCT